MRVAGPGKSYGLPLASVTYTPQLNGTVRVVERITFDFQGWFSGAFRDIPMKDGESVTGIVVLRSWPAGAAAPAEPTVTMPDLEGLPPGNCSANF